MDTKRIEDLFANWRKKPFFLTRKGALSLGRSPLAYIIGACPSLFYVFVFLLITDGNGPVSLLCAIIFAFLVVSAFPVKCFYKDRMEIKHLCGLVKRKFYYTDLKKIVYSSYFDKKTNVGKTTLIITFKDLLYQVDRDSIDETRFDCLVQLFSCHKTLFVNECYYMQMAKLFAYMITIKSDPQYQYVETQFSLRYLAQVCGNNFADYDKNLASGIKRYNAYRRMNKLPAELGCASICFDILQNMGVRYADRLNLFSALFECAYASDGMVDDVELSRLSRFAYYLRIKEWDFLSLKYRFEAESKTKGQREGTENARQRERYQSAYSNRLKEAAYKILELDEKSTLDEVKSAYRSLVKSCHPDTLPSTATEAEREEASQRFRTITEAYDFLCAELVTELVSATK